MCGANCVGPVLLDWLLVLHWCSKVVALHARLVMSIVCFCVCLSAGVGVLLQPLSFYGFHLPQCHPQPGPAPWHHMEAALSSSHCAIPCCSYESCFSMSVFSWLDLVCWQYCPAMVPVLLVQKTTINADWLRHRCFHMLPFNSFYSYGAMGVPDKNGDLQNRICSSNSKL